MKPTRRIAAPERPRICIIGYKRLTRLVHSVLPDYAGQADFEVIDEVFDEAMLAARQRENDQLIDVFISAGANASILRASLKTPVATIKVSGYDVLMALLKAREISDRIGLVTYQETAPELDAVTSLLNLQIDHRTYQTADESRDCFRALAAAHYPVIVGTSTVVDLAEQHDLRGVLTYSTKSIRLALDEAIELARVARLEAARLEQLNSVLQHLQEAVLAVDAQGRITALNPAMENILMVPAEAALGKLLDTLSPALTLDDVLRSGQDVLAQVMELEQVRYVANRVAILERGAVTGAMLTLYDARVIQNAETRLRSATRPRKPLARYYFEQIIGSSPAFTRAKTLATRFAETGSTVLITGESGTGKELFAQAIHNASKRRGKPFVAINCAAFPETLLESELFGYEEGAFTGSRKGGKSGLFEVAHTGTLFLDEIGDMPLSLQTRLLRVLQEKEVVRLGSVQTIPVDVRIIAATHQTLSERVRLNLFRNDLYYRLNILHLHLPPLRERSADIAELATLLLQAALQNLSSRLAAALAVELVLPLLLSHAWPGNVRELENVTERLAVFFAQTTRLDQADLRDLPSILPELFEKPSSLATSSPTPPTSKEADLSNQDIQRVLKQLGGNRKKAAEQLGMSRTTLWRRLRSRD